MSSLLARVAGAPISWGVCEVPGWGHQLGVERVLGEMREVGLAATELGPDGFLPSQPGERARTLASYGMSAVGGFVPVVLHDPSRDVLAEVRVALDALVASGAGTLVLAADSGSSGYDDRPVLDGDAWTTLFDNLDRIVDAATGLGLTGTLHPHVGTVVESRAEVERVVEQSDVALCLDTGHLLIGGTDPAQLAAQVPGRVKHAHLKDVDAGLAERVRAGDLLYSDAVRQGLYRPLGEGDVDIAAVVHALEANGYDGWYVMEQDTVLASDPTPGTGPVDDVRASIRFLDGVVS